MISTRRLLSIGLLPAIAHAQINAIATITDHNLTYTQSAISTTETPGTADVLNGTGGDILYQHWWWFRVGGDTREYSFKADATATRVVTNPLMVTTWPNVDSRGVFSATLTQVAVGALPTGGSVYETMTVTNLTNAPITIDLFSYTDYDVNGSGTDLARGNNSDQVVIDASNTALAGEFLATGNTGASVTAFATLRGLLTNTTVDNLTGWSGSFPSGDYTGGYQWSLSLPANGTASVSCQLVTLGCRPNSTNYGTGTAGTAGIPTITSEYPVLRSAASVTPIKLAAGRPNSLAGLLLNLNSGNTNLFGINVLVDLTGATTLFQVTDAAGAATYNLGLPGNPVFCGVHFFGQWLVSDPLGAGGLASATNGIDLSLGAW